MAEAAVRFLRANIEKTMAEDLLVGVEDEVRLLEAVLKLISNLLESCSGEPKQQLFQLISREIEDLADEAGDLMDSYALIVAEYKKRNNDSSYGFLRAIIYKLVQSARVGRVCEEMKSIRRQLEHIYTFGVQILPPPKINHNKNLNLISTGGFDDPTAALSDVDDLYYDYDYDYNYDYGTLGFEAEKMMIIKWLTANGAGGDATTLTTTGVNVVGIWGIGGIGKTTLAKGVFNDLVISNHFDLRVWVSLRQVNTAREFMETAVKSVMELGQQDEESVKEMSLEQLRIQLYRYLKHSRYLLVLDDVWCSKPYCAAPAEADLIDMYRLFPRNSLGSRIMVTTRYEKLPKSFLGNYISSSSCCYLHLLNSDESWRLMKKKVFQGRECPWEELTEIGIRIAHKCAGLPLAVSLVAGILQRHKTTQWWSRVLSSTAAATAAKTNTTTLQYDESGFIELSYNYLPHYLRPCFLYFAHFPEDCEIPAKQLITLWVAEGFVFEKLWVSAEQVAENYLQDLIDSCLIYTARKKFDGGVKSCRIHDQLRLFCISKQPPSSRRSSGLVGIHSSPNLRSLLCFGPPRVSSKQLNSLVKSLQLLRVLDLWSVDVDNVPSQIDKLSCLRYLRLKSDSARTFPASLCNLFNLQTLVVAAPLVDRPLIDVWKMPELRHFYFNGEAVLVQPPRQKTRAQTLPLVVMANSSCHSLPNLQTLSFISPDSCTGALLCLTPNLTKLGLYGDLEKHKDLAFNNLSALKCLRELKLSRDLRYKRMTSLLPDGVQFPPTLLKLTLSHTQLSTDPMKQLGDLPKLQILKLLDSAYAGNTLDCSASEFHQLKVLKLVNLGITTWSLSVQSMPSLQILVINRCPGLLCLPCSLYHMSTLRELHLWCPNHSVEACARNIETSSKNYPKNKKLKLLIYYSAQDRDRYRL